MPKKPTPEELMEELREVQACRSAITDLTSPSFDMHLVDRNNVARLQGFFDRYDERLLNDLEQVLRPDS
ncbi:hypothetical protein [Marinobacter sp. OP 3.4]|uniref:hypothetical protein n=1 Tax=Marinobacter sp. OP 3.4 TaxID=3076501 RepID=UPI002E1E11ED